MVPNLPTDNLYKFIALAGVFLFCFFLYTGKQDTDNLQEQIYSFESKANQINIRIKWLQKDLDYRKSLIINSDLPLEEIEGLMLENKGAQKELQNMELEVSKLHILDKRKNQMSEQLESSKLLYLWGKFLSLTLAFIGFFLWYTKVQVYLDINIKKNIQPIMATSTDSNCDAA